jgi:hypothetical protein
MRMAITTENTKERYVGTGSAATFAYNFKINAAAELEVLRANTDDTDQETLVLNTDYTVTGVGASSGNVVLSGGNLATGKVLVINWKGTFVQTTEFENQGGFFPKTHENAFDYVTRLLLRLKEQVDRCPKVSLTSGDTGDALVETITESAEAAAADAAAAAAAKNAALAAQAVCEDAQSDIEDFINNVVIHNFEATATAGQTYVDVTGFSLAADLVNVDCYIDGVKQAKSTLTRTSDTRLTFGGALVGGEKIEVKSASFNPDAASEAAASAAIATAKAAEAAASAASIPGLASQAEAEAGTDNTKYVSALRVKQAIDVFATPAGSWTDYFATSTKVGWVTPSGYIWVLKLGKLCFVAFSISGTSNATGSSFTLPHTPARGQQNVCMAVDNSAWVSDTSKAEIGTNGVVVLHKNNPEDAWTASGTKQIIGQFFYEVE